MVYNPPEIDEGSNSKWNAGQFQMARLNELQQQLNLANNNPLAFNVDFGIWNFELIIRTSTSVILEAGDKLGAPEKKDVLALKKAIEEAIKKHPIINNSKKVQRKNWNIMEKWIFKYQATARGLLDKHQFNSPTDEDEGL